MGYMSYNKYVYKCLKKPVVKMIYPTYLLPINSCCLTSQRQTL